MRREASQEAPGVKVVDNPKKNEYPLAIYAAGKDDTFVGRIRKDESVKYGLNMWIVSTTSAKAQHSTQCR
jgi:aspartate-semialdehyde dehydrogenase